LKLVVGLGNPGSRYAATRHNVGARIVERLAERHRIDLAGRRFEGRFSRGRLAGEDVGLLLPETWMNESGLAVAQALRGLPMADPTTDLLVAYDDVDLPFGRLRLRAGGGAGGHRGMDDVLARLGRRDLPRLRFGVGRPPPLRETTDWVLEPFTRQEEVALPGLLDRAAAAVESFVGEGIEAAMARFNACE
jgi:PTH1 family peptidyl-tRNA hydrolase